MDTISLGVQPTERGYKVSEEAQEIFSVVQHRAKMCVWKILYRTYAVQACTSGQRAEYEGNCMWTSTGGWKFMRSERILVYSIIAA